MHIPDVKTAVEIFDRNSEIGNAEIHKLFGAGKQKIAAMKHEVRKVMHERGAKTMLPRNVDTTIAYKVWGIDIEDYRKRYTRLKRNGVY